LCQDRTYINKTIRNPIQNGIDEENQYIIKASVRESRVLRVDKRETT
jgi:hypothetical protein